MNSLANCLRCGALPCTCGWQEPAAGEDRTTHLPGWVNLVVGVGAVAGLGVLLIAGAVWLLPEQSRAGGSSAKLEVTAPVLAQTVAPAPKPARHVSRPSSMPMAQIEGVAPAAKQAPSTEPAVQERVREVVPSMEPREAVKEKKESANRRNRSTEQELRELLARVPEVGLGPQGAALFSAYQEHLRVNRDPGDPTREANCFHVVHVRPDLATLPLRDGAASMLSAKAAGELGLLARKLREYLTAIAPAGIDGKPRDWKLLRDRMRMDLRGKKPEWLRAAAVPTLNQILMAEDAPTRALLVEILAAIPEPPATVALAHRAVFDLAPDVRAAATDALKGRDPEAWRPTVLKALSYPWAPAADFAAEALIRLRDTGAVSDLVVLLKQPRLGRPIALSNGRVVLQDLVKLNHLGNCMVCHPPALRGNEPVLADDPIQTVTGVASMAVPTGPRISVMKVPGCSKHGPTVSVERGPVAVSGLVEVPIVIRGDITFLRQDFAVGFPVVPQRPPALQRVVQDAPAIGRALGLAPPPVRFDFVVRTRQVTKAEEKQWQAFGDDTNPQRDAVLFALRELTGQDHGETTDAWVKAFPDAEPDVRAGKLAQRVVRADNMARLGMLQAYQAGEGVEYTQALGRAIPRLAGLARESARLALASRLTKLPTDELRTALGDRDAEVRRAAARVCGQREERELVPDLVPLLDEDATRPQAREALKRLTGVDLPDGGSWRKWLAGAALAGE